MADNMELNRLQRQRRGQVSPAELEEYKNASLAELTSLLDIAHYLFCYKP